MLWYMGTDSSKRAHALDDSDSNEGTDSEIRHTMLHQRSSDSPLGMVN
jgi:hypothetical protein